MNELLVVKAGISIGPYKIGMNRTEVWSKSRYPITSFYKTDASIQRTDDITLLGIHVHYDEDGRSNFIEAFTSVKYNSTVLEIEELVINGQCMKDIFALTELLPYSFKKNDYGYESKTAGVGFFCHDFEGPNSLVDGIYIMK